MLTIKQSTSLTQLLSLLSDGLIEEKNRFQLSIFRGQDIIVQSPAMGKWIQTELAKKLGIVANLNFPMLGRYIWETQQAILRSDIEHDAYSKNAMTWRLMHLIETESTQLPNAVTEHLSNMKNSMLARFNFCQKQADLFDQYLMFRPQWIEQWENNELSSKQKLESWQAKLWQLLSQDKAFEDAFHRVSLMNACINKLDQFGPANDKQSVSIFAAHQIAPQQLEFLKALSSVIDITLYIKIPTPHFFSDIQSEKKQAWLLSQNQQDTAVEDLHLCTGNPLLASLGSSIKQYIDLLTEHLNELDSSDNFDELEDIDHQSLSLLQYTQHEIKDLSFAGMYDSWLGKQHQASFVRKNNDDSVLIHSCHSRFRELQIVYHQILSFFNNDSSLRAEDIIIMAPNPGDYLPYVDSVFHQQDLPYLPIAVSDISILSQQAIAQCFFSLFHFAEQRFKVSEVIHLLKQDFISQAWSFSENDIGFIEIWAEENDIHWGWNSESKSQWNIPTEEKHTWQFAQQKSVLGLALDSHAALDQSIFNCASIEHETILGKLFDFLDALSELQSSIHIAREAEEWKTYIQQVINHFFVAQNKEQEHTLQSIFQNLSELCHDCDTYFPKKTIPFAIIENELRNALNKPLQNFQLITGKINFTNCLALQGIPFKVICVLGMNDGEYPTFTTQEEVDLMANTPRQLGDRNRREEDAYQFLQCIVSAQEKLHISYIGFDVTEKHELNPSVFVKELINYCDAVCIKDQPQDDILINHPLWSFNQQYFLENKNKHLNNFSTQDFETTQESFTHHYDWLDSKDLQAVNSESDNPNISFSDIIRFYKKPADWLLKHYQIRLEPQLRVLEDEDQQSLNNLEKYYYFNDAIAHGLSNVSFEQWKQWQLTHPRFDNTYNSQEQLLDLWNKAEQVLAASNEKEHNPCTKLCRFDFDGIHFETKLNGSQLGNQFYLYTYKSNSCHAGDLIDAWLKHLIACTNNLHPKTTIYFFSNKTLKQYSFQLIETSEAKQHLCQLIELYVNANTRFTSYEPTLAKAFCENKSVELSEHMHQKNRFLNISQWSNSMEFEETATLIFEPLLAALETGKKK